MEIKKLKDIREENEKTQKFVAESLGVSLGTYAMNETAHDTITLKNLIKFCDLFNVSLDYVFDFTKNKNYSNMDNNYNKDILKVRLKECRKESGYTQVQIGEMLNTDHSVWCRYEQGKTIIPTTFLYIFCQKLNVSADYLLGRINERKYIK